MLNEERICTILDVYTVAIKKLEALNLSTPKLLYDGKKVISSLGEYGLQEFYLFVLIINSLIHSCASHVYVALEDGDYELVPADTEVAQGGDVNIVNIEAASEPVVEQ